MDFGSHLCTIGTIGIIGTKGTIGHFETKKMADPTDFRTNYLEITILECRNRNNNHRNLNKNSFKPTDLLVFY